MARPLLDLTRTLARASRLAPGSIDRVERAWTRRLAADPAARFLISAGPRHVLLDGGSASRPSSASERASAPAPSSRTWRGPAEIMKRAAGSAARRRVQARSTRSME
ncbi:MAG: hypothetical protein R6V44_03590, partial [Paracoccaceae bacterium]